MDLRGGGMGGGSIEKRMYSPPKGLVPHIITSDATGVHIYECAPPVQSQLIAPETMTGLEFLPPADGNRTQQIEPTAPASNHTNTK